MSRIPVLRRVTRFGAEARRLPEQLEELYERLQLDKVITTKAYDDVSI